MAHGHLRQIDVLLRLWYAHGVAMPLVHTQLRSVRSHAHAETVWPTAATVDDVLWSVVLAVHGVATTVLSAGSKGWSSLRHHLTATSPRGSAWHPLWIRS